MSTRLFRICYFECGSNYINYKLLGPCLQSTFCPCHLGCGSNRLCLEATLGSEVSPHLHPCINVGVLSHVLIFYFINWLLEGSLESHLYSSNFQIKDSLCFYFVTQCVSIGTKGWCMGNSLWHWLSARVLSGWLSPFFSWKLESTKLHKVNTGLVSWLCISPLFQWLFLSKD